ncbi:hypothetical protein [Blastococcus litoris]|uniref:hypothetical protein n=1 Tax=Blastococcus litoris TaxID=2171622 RepID=UPI000E30A45F|nr:hypothetical protein [Blastococcus litoris]
MRDEAGWVRLAGDRPRRTSSAALVLIWLAWLLVPPLVVFGGAIGAAPLFGEQPTAAERSQASTLYLVASALALGLPLLGVLLTWRTRKVAAACFAAAMIVVAVPVAVLLAEEFRGGFNGPAPDSGPPVCQEHSGGDTRCPGG